MSCQGLTKSNKPCKIKVSSNSKNHNGKILCHIHLKNYINKNKEVIYENEVKSCEIEIKPVRCNCTNKTGKRCLKYTKNKNGICHIHDKINLSNCIEDENKEKTKCKQKDNFKEKFEIKSPSIKYKIENHSDSCYVCLEDTDIKLSCGHFIHSKCLLELLSTSLNLNVRYNYLEYNNKYFIITECQYCKQISIMKNIPNTFKLKKQNMRKHKIKIDDYSIFNEINNVFLNHGKYYVPYSINECNQKLVNELKDFVFNKISVLIFDNYLSIKHNKINSLKYKKINSKMILSMLNKEILKNINSKDIYNHIKTRLEKFVILLERIVEKMLNLDNTQEDIVNLINIF